ncbi:major facilitator superfamily domain-containing protein [Lipomyces oligophaga]|uniref:major facilitator superfamily domain-containing protein n=1 Tax=Lipomyces oligophaga TaxID=45792 RepID=UPI0034CEC12C
MSSDTHPLASSADSIVSTDSISESESEPLLSQTDVERAGKSADEEEELIDQIEEEELSSSALLSVFVSLYVGIFLAALDGTIVATLLAHIASEFNEFRSVSWIATGYMIVLAAFQPLYGKISDIYGRKPVLLVCNVLFGVGSVLCGIAPTMWFLVIARMVAGLGGGGLTSLTAITLSDIVPLRQRGVLQGIGNILWGCGAAFGGVVGGLITETFGWRWAFLSQGPIIALSILSIIFNLNLPPKDAENSRDKLKRIDFLGSFTLVVALVTFLLAASIGGTYYPWFSGQVIVSLLFSATFFCAFIYVELFIAREPIIPLQLLANPTVFGSSFTSWFMNMTYYAQIYYIAIYFIAVQGISETRSGSTLIPHFIGDSIGALIVGYYMRATGRYFPMIVLAAICMIFGSLILCFVGMNTSRWLIMAIVFWPGFGFGLYLTITLIALVAAVPHEFQAVSTSIQYGFKGTGSTLGISLSTAVFQNVLAAKLSRAITGPGAEEIINRVKDSIDEVHNLPPEMQDAVIHSYLDSVRAVFIFATVLSVLCAGTSFMMKEHKLHTSVRRR